MISIVVPVYNEGGNIVRLMERVDEQIKTDKEIIGVYDFDEDDTVPVLNKIRDKYSFKIRLEKNAVGEGTLNAIKTGFSLADKSTVLVVMADLSDSLDIVDEMYHKITESGYDVVCGSRYMKGGRQIGGPFFKGFLSRMAGLSLHWISRIPTHDVTNSFKMYRNSMLKAIKLESTGGFEVGMEIAVKTYIAGYRITEIPYTWYDRTEGVSRFKTFQWMPKYMKWYFVCMFSKIAGKYEFVARAFTHHC